MHQNWIAVSAQIPLGVGVSDWTAVYLPDNCLQSENGEMEVDQVDGDIIAIAGPPGW